MATFLESIGIEMRGGTIDEPSLFPGSFISGGSLIVDESILVAPGDALHEAAHIALAPPERRFTDVGLVEAATGGEELTTIAWSWAALLELDLQPTRAATRLRSSIAGVAGSTSVSRFCRRGKWHSTSRTHSCAE
jgi:hypothetical protein